MKIIAVNGRPFSVEQLSAAVSGAKTDSKAITLVTSNSGNIETHTIDDHGGLRYPQVERASGTTDCMSDILRPLTSAAARAK